MSDQQFGIARILIVASKNTRANDVVELQTLLRSAGIRSTAARVEVLRQLRKAKSPLSHAELATELSPLGFDKATVFRNLSDLTDAGLIVRTELGDHVWRFELRDGDHADAAAHPHFLCTTCGQVTCVADAPWVSRLKNNGVEVGSVTEILLKGHCKLCQ
jgi:Fur family ferric uptake transcriptional regulator